MISGHKTRNKERINVKNVKHFKSPKNECRMGKKFSSTNDSGDAFLWVENPVQIGWIR